jgi:hypothetical protein
MEFITNLKNYTMAKYSKGAGKKVERAMHEMHEGKLKSGKSDKKVKSRKQAIAIGLSEARKEGAKVPKKSSSKSASKKSASKSSSKSHTPGPKKGSKPGPKKGSTKK